MNRYPNACTSITWRPRIAALITTEFGYLTSEIHKVTYTTLVTMIAHLDGAPNTWKILKNTL